MILWPQYLILALITFGMGSSAARYGKEKTDRYDLTDVFLAPVIMLIILYCGHFFDGLLK